VLAAVSFAVVRSRIAIPGLDPLFRDALLWLVMMSLLGLSLHTEPLHAGLSLLVFLGAAELLVFTLFQRRMLVGLWMGGQILLGLAIAYLVVARGLAELSPEDGTQEGLNSDGRFFGGQP
jgi:ABC-type sulfate transport system permease subunit